MTTAPRPWLECADLSPDVLSEVLSKDIFALDLSALAEPSVRDGFQFAGKRRNDSLGGLMVRYP